MQERARELVGMLSEECRSVSDVQEMLKHLFKGTLEAMLEAEMDEHLGYEKHEGSGDLSGNSRNGYNTKRIQSEMGETELRIPRDRRGEFRPRVIERYQTKTEGLEEQIIAMYGKGMSNRDIEDHMRDIYGVEASASIISRITDKILPQIQEWQSRPLEAVYPIVFLDGIVFKVRQDAKVINKCLYSVLGVNMSGRKELLGLWVSENESASFWLSVCNELKNRGVERILVACRDNLSGFGRAIQTAFPNTEQQLCVIHQIRNSTKYVSYKDLKAVMADLKRVYGAPTLPDAEYRLVEFGEKWSGKYPQIVKSWEENWAELTTYFKYPAEFRRVIYTTNAVEGFHRMLRKYTKTKTIYPTDDALKKSVFLAIQNITRKWTMPIANWGVIMGQMMIFFEDELAASGAM